jgi:hypothetical protein
MCFQSAPLGIPFDMIASHYGLIAQRDIIIANLGVHMNEAHRKEQLQNVVARCSNTAILLPIVIYRETSPQHFEGQRSGVYEDASALIYDTCLDSIDMSEEPRSAHERAALVSVVPLLAVNPAAANAGAIKVSAGVNFCTGRTDCTHW